MDYYGERVADRYDASIADTFEPAIVEPTVSFLAHLAGGDPVLELGVGTGRIALPLSERGLAVHGIDLSPAMIAKLQAKAGAERIGVTVGDFAHTRIPETFGLVYVTYNTIMYLTTQDEQVACFRNAAEHLKPGGNFVVEVCIPALQRIPPGEYDVTTQRRLVSHDSFGEASRLYSFVDGESDGSMFSIPFRYVWPSELDLMAQLAQMTLRERWRDWERQAFTNDSPQHVSVWEKLDP